MDIIQNTANARKDPSMSFDAFCEDISKEFARCVIKDKIVYMGMYLYANENLNQAQLNLFRDNIARCLESLSIDCPVVAGAIFPDTLPKYEDSQGKRENSGWYPVNVWDFIRKGALLL